MRARRPPDAARCLAADAGRLPFPDQSFDAAMSVLSDHHWPDPVAGLREMQRVPRRVVVFQFDTAQPGAFWLTRDYLPEFAGLARARPTLTERTEAICARTQPVPVPWDCAKRTPGPVGRGNCRTRRRSARAAGETSRARPGGRSGNSPPGVLPRGYWPREIDCVQGRYERVIRVTEAYPVTAK